jgi:SAM-dependent methyltransferase
LECLGHCGALEEQAETPVKLKAVEYFRCPHCHGALTINREAGPPNTFDLQEGVLACGICGEHYPIIKGIPRFVTNDNYAQSFGLQWSLHARTQLDKCNGLSLSKERFYTATQWPETLAGQLLLEAGSGAGRFTEIACNTQAEVFSFDYSVAVETNYINSLDYKKLHVFQADIYHIPLETAMFDKVFCFGVLQHTPDAERAFKNLVTYMKPGGEIVIDIYRKSFISLLGWKYFLRPLTRRMPKEQLYTIVSSIVPPLVPVARYLRNIAGRYGARFVPIVEYSHLGLSEELNLDWSILDTFDMYAPEHDHPQSLQAVTRWFHEAELKNIVVERGPNGIVGRGVKP